MSSAFHTIRNFSADYYSFSFSLGSGTIGGKLNDSSGSRFTSDSDTDTLPGSGAAFDFSQFDSTTFSSFAGTDETVIGTIDSFHLEGIPEPSGLSLLGVAAIGLLAGRSRVRRTAMGG